MLTLNHRIKIDSDTIASPNLCEKFGESDLRLIGEHCWEAYDRDKRSRTGWELRMSAAMDLALQVQTQKNFPWPGCSNIKFPLVTIAALQFHSRAYPEIVDGRNVVKAQVVGNDPEGIAAAAVERISKHMSWQLLEQQEDWEEGEDRCLLNTSIIGCSFKKSYYSASEGHNVSEFVQAKDLVFDYWAKSIEGARTKTHILPMFRNELHERAMRGVFDGVLESDWFKTDAVPTPDQLRSQSDERTGVREPEASSATPFTMLEQHCWLDLDGDGYEEPYIVTFEESTHCVVRIVTRFDRIEDVEFNEKKQIIKINANEYFTKRPFIPNPDGSLMDIGFGMFLGPLNESVNSAINQLFDAGTMSNTAGGFLGRGAKIRGGAYEFSPFAWNRVDSSGDDLRKNIIPLDVREPSNVMFSLLSLLIDYTNRISGATDMLTGVNPGQNTPAETARTMVEQGQKIYSAIFKRTWKSLKGEFKKLAQLNAIYLPTTVRFGADGQSVSRDDYRLGTTAVVPVADPLITSEAARFAQAQMIRQAAATAPGYDADAVERKYLKALGVSNPEEVYKGAASTPPPKDVRLQIQELKAQIAQGELENARMEFMATLQETMRLNNAKIENLHAQAMKFISEAQGIPDKNRINELNAQANVLRESNKNIETQILGMIGKMHNDRNNQRAAGALPALEGPGGNQGPDGLANPEAGGLEGQMGGGAIHGGV